MIGLSLGAVLGWLVRAAFIANSRYEHPEPIVGDPGPAYRPPAMDPTEAAARVLRFDLTKEKLP